MKSLKKTKKKSKSKRSKSKSLCKQRLQKKISINMKEMKEDKKYVSRAQAIAVAYSQIKKKYPHCKQYLTK